ncbi:MAG: response regulator [Phycisphaerae bacterium]
MNILLVEDDPIALAIVRNALSKLGHAVHTAGDGEAALTALRNQPCPIVITDWNMPRMDGLELCRCIRRSSRLGYVYLIVLTARETRDDLVAALEAGADDFVPKPCEAAELAIRLRAAERVLALQTRDMAIFAIAKLAEARDSGTGAHLERVRGYAAALAEHLRTQAAFADEVDAEFVELIDQTSPLHDIGKVGIPDAILLKPGALTPLEYEVMKSHTVIGAQTLRAAASRFAESRFLTIAHDIARHHHEHFDGAGYPDGLKGRAIPLAARIVAVADVYDALTTQRAYKNAFSHEMARQSICDQAGKQFDPEIVAAFRACEGRFRQICRDNADERRGVPAPTEAPVESALCGATDAE